MKVASAVFAQAHQAFMEAVEAPDIVGVLAGAGERVVEPEIGAVNGFGFFDLVLLQQQSTQSMARGLHEAPRLVVTHGCRRVRLTCEDGQRPFRN